MRSPTRSRADARIARMSLLLESSSPRARRRPSPPWWSGCRPFENSPRAHVGRRRSGLRAEEARRLRVGVVRVAATENFTFRVVVSEGRVVPLGGSNAKTRESPTNGLRSLQARAPAHRRAHETRVPGPWPPDRKPRRCVFFAKSPRVATEAATNDEDATARLRCQIRLESSSSGSNDRVGDPHRHPTRVHERRRVARLSLTTVSLFDTDRPLSRVPALSPPTSRGARAWTPPVSNPRREL